MNFATPRYVAYLTAGLGHTVEAALAIVEGGADILEIGVPFSDPILDGPVIETAMQQALRTGLTVEAILEQCLQIKQTTGVPIVLFSYYNPLKILGSAFYVSAAKHQIDALLIVDLPLEEQQSHLQLCRQNQLDTVQLIAPNTPDNKIEHANQCQPAFHYYACRAGTTGVQASMPADFPERIATIRQHIDRPLVAGFGISSAHMAADCLSAGADGFVIGSALVQAMLDGCSYRALTQLTRSLDGR